MLHLTESAVLLLDATKRQQGVPQDFGVRVAGAAAPEGEVGVAISFAEGPADGDVVDEQHGTRVFVAADVADALTEAELDASVSVSANGSTPATLVLRAGHGDL